MKPALVLEDENLISQVVGFIDIIGEGDLGRSAIGCRDMEDFAAWWV